MMSLWDALRMNMMISYQELVRTFPKYIEIDGEYYSTTSLPRGSSFLFTCASRIADDQVNVWKKHAAKEGKIDLFFELESRIHTAMLNANFQKLNSDLTKTGICDLITAVP